MFDGVPSTEPDNAEFRILLTSNIPTSLAFGYFTIV